MYAENSVVCSEIDDNIEDNIDDNIEDNIDDNIEYNNHNSQCNKLNEFVDLYNKELSLYGDIENDNEKLLIKMRPLDPYNYINNISLLHIYMLIVGAFIINIYLAIFLLPVVLSSSLVISFFIILFILALSLAICILIYNLIQRNI